MPCGPQLVGRVPPPAVHAPRFIASRPCLGPGSVPPSDDDRRKARALVRWLAWTALALLASLALVTLITAHRPWET